jgi:dolichol-phosphate mannosyltransferase
MKLSIIVPAYNEGNNVKVACEEIEAVLRNTLQEIDYEIIFVDDGSLDDTFVYLSDLNKSNPNVRVIKLLSNTGAHMAIRAGLEHAEGDMACFLACDLQDPPKIIPDMLDALKDPVQIVWATRSIRKDPWTSRLFARIFYGLARAMVSKDLPPSGASMFLLGSDALRAVHKFKERNLTLEGLFSTMGFKQSYITYDRKSRASGASKWTVAKRLKLFADFFVGYSYFPVRLMSYLGIILASIGFLYATFLILRYFIYNLQVAGWTSLMVVLLIIGGVQMVMIGVIGEYVWRTLDEVRARPRYVIKTILNSKRTEAP